VEPLPVPVPDGDVGVLDPEQPSPADRTTPLAKKSKVRPMWTLTPEIKAISGPTGQEPLSPGPVQSL
jgi:hypothetical protein